jgi:hypothetical protein
MTQLTLIDTPTAWRLDDHTREVGRDGIARARAALRAGLGAGGSPDRSPPPGRRGGADRRDRTKPPRPSAPRAAA